VIDAVLAEPEGRVTMTNGQKFTPMLKTGGLWAKTSAKGGRYLTGRLGGVKVLILANRDRQSDNDPSHILYFVEGTGRRQGAQDCGGEQRASQIPSQPQRGGFHGQGQRVPDHQAPLDYEDAPEWAR
jgi:hypothetical protein